MNRYHKLTDVELALLEDEISGVYKRSTTEIGEKWREHMDKVRDRAAKAYDKIQKAETDEEKAAAVEDYKRILRNATLQNKHYAEMIDETTARLSHANEIALDYANGRMPKVYTINYNGASEGIGEAVAGYSFTMCDEGTVRYLIDNDKLLLPPKKLDPVKDKAWNTKKLNAEVLQGIIQGESVGKIADRVERVTEANRVSALRAARTMTTGAENKGRLDSYTNAERMGIKLKKRWMAAMDNRTRHTHRLLDGQMREKDKPFEVEGRSIMYPGDPSAAPDLVYNCRCTMVAEVEGTSSYPLKPEGKPAWADGLTDYEYEQWKLFGADGLKEKKRLTRDEKKGIISDEIKRLTFNTGEEVNNFFYYDSDKQKTFAEENSLYSIWFSGLSEDEKEAISWYTLDGYGDINDYLRKRDGWEDIPKELVDDASTKIDSAISRFVLKDNIIVQRGIRNFYADSIIESSSWNDIHDIIGKTFFDSGYGSSTALKNNPVAVAKPVLLEIEIPAGIGRGAYINELAGQNENAEYEFLIARDSKFRITDVVINNEPMPPQTIIKMRMIVNE